MAITSYDDAITGGLPLEIVWKASATAEAAGVLHNPWYQAGVPGAALAATGTIDGAALAGWPGQIPFPVTVAGEDVHLLSVAASQSASGIAQLLLCDRLWHNTGIVPTTTTAQAITHPGLPPRDRDGAADGAGVLLALEVSTASTNSSAVTTVTASYTAQDGTAGQTAVIPSFPATSQVGTFVPFALAAGDTGVRTVESVTLGTSLGATAVVHLVQYRVLATCPVPSGAEGRVGLIDTGMPLLHADTTMFPLVLPAATTLGALTAHVAYTQG